jgi:hypothetical protein
VVRTAPSSPILDGGDTCRFSFLCFSLTSVVEKTTSLVTSQAKFEPKNCDWYSKGKRKISTRWTVSARLMVTGSSFLCHVTSPIPVTSSLTVEAIGYKQMAKKWALWRYLFVYLKPMLHKLTSILRWPVPVAVDQLISVCISCRRFQLPSGHHRRALTEGWLWRGTIQAVLYILESCLLFCMEEEHKIGGWLTRFGRLR